MPSTAAIASTFSTPRAVSICAMSSTSSLADSIFSMMSPPRVVVVGHAEGGAAATHRRVLGRIDDRAAPARRSPPSAPSTPSRPTSSGPRDEVVLRGRHAHHRHEIGGSGAGHQPADRLDAPAGVLHVVDQRTRRPPPPRCDRCRSSGTRRPSSPADRSPAAQRPLDPVLPHALLHPLAIPVAASSCTTGVSAASRLTTFVGTLPAATSRMRAQHALAHDPLALVRPAERVGRDDDVVELQDRDRSDRPAPARRRPAPRRRYAGPAGPRTAPPDRRAGRGPC